LDVLRQNKTNLQMSLISAGHRYAIGRVNSRMTAAGAANEYLSGCEYISWINQCCEYDETALKGLLDRMAAVAAKVFCRERLTISVSDNTGDALTEKLAASFAAGTSAPAAASFALLPSCREGILIPAGVGFAVKGAHLKNFGKEYTGSVAVIAKMLGLEYLWNAIRVQGGAYGAGFSGGGYGELLFHTYRDPNPGRSLGCFDESANVIREYCKNGGQLDKFILGAVSASDLPLSADGKISLAEARYFKGITHDEVERTHRELLHTGYEEILDLCNTLEEMAKTENICVVGGQTQLDGCGEKLAEIRQILA
jgi:Zn-dependent M16 (insulinase) family peptidase